MRHPSITLLHSVMQLFFLSLSLLCPRSFSQGTGFRDNRAQAVHAALTAAVTDFTFLPVSLKQIENLCLCQVPVRLSRGRHKFLTFVKICLKRLEFKKQQLQFGFKFRSTSN